VVTADDDLTATLDQIRERARYAVTYDDWHQVGRDARRLIAAVDKVLEKAGEWERKASEADDRAEAASGRGDGDASLMLSGRGQALHDCSFALREAITRELSGTSGNE